MNNSFNNEFPQVQIPGTEVRPLLLNIVKDMEYQIYVSLPENYATSSETYPTLYFLDAWEQFGILKQTYWLLRFFNEVPPLLLVEIAFNGNIQDLLYNRSRDYTPTYVLREKLGDAASVTPVSGGAVNFSIFFETELFPMVESEYRADKSDRAIFGTSYGGLFATFALFCRTGLFQRYLLGNPSIWWDNEIVFKYEEIYANTHDALTVKVFLAYGSEEGEKPIEQWTRFLDQIKNRNYEGLDLSSMMFEGETHMSVIPATISRALRVLYNM